LFVEAPIYNAFLSSLVNATRALRVGRGLDPHTQVGPLITAEHRARVAGYVDLARAEGAEILCGGRAPSSLGLADGYYYLPTIIAGLRPSSRVCQEEIFGPVLVVFPFSDEDDLVAMANETPYGLAAGIWTSDDKRAWRLASRLHAATVYVNTYKQFSISTPFGGEKGSGLGREKGSDGLTAYMRQKSICWGLDPDPLAWAAPLACETS
jgi:acyl-CoA reductase-like NAD-dependent aldehyde dehydrogenase